jgi:hypothetical protein
MQSKGGIVILHFWIQNDDLQDALAELPDKTEIEVKLLFDPDDKLNVKKAVQLICALMKLKSRPLPGDSTAHGMHKAILFFAEMLGLLLRPFTELDMCLDKQIISLVAYCTWQLRYRLRMEARA